MTGLSKVLDRVHAIGPVLAEHAERSENLGRLADESIEALHDAGVFRINLPTDLGGPALPLSESVEVYRVVASYDASAGWVAAICATGPLIGRFVSRPCFDEIFGDGRSLAAGSLNPLGASAAAVEGGFLLSGTAAYASGCRHASWLMAGAWVQRDGRRSFVDGNPEFIGVLMPMEHATVNETWHVSGMRATGSNDCVLEDVFLPAEGTFVWRDPVSAFERARSGASRSWCSSEGRSRRRSSVPPAVR